MLSRPAPITLRCRAFSTTAQCLARTSRNRPDIDYESVPPYPFGPAQWFKQSNRGLYGGSKKQFGNNVSQETEIKTRRWWKPNMQYKKLYSQALDRQIRMRVSTRVLRTIDKVGGLDEYLLGEKTGRIKELGVVGWALRWRIMQTPVVQERFREQRRQLGLSTNEDETLEIQGTPQSADEVQAEVLRFDQALDEHERSAAASAAVEKEASISSDGSAAILEDGNRFENYKESRAP